MAEALELSDEALGGLGGVAAGEVVAPEVVVSSPLVSMCQQAQIIECLTVPSALACPSWGFLRR